MASPMILILLAALLPGIAGIVQLAGRLWLPKEQTGYSLTRIAAIGSFVLTFVAMVWLFQTTSPEEAQRFLLELAWAKGFGLAVPVERLSICWMLLTSGGVALLLSQKDWLPKKPDTAGPFLVVLMLLLAASFGVILATHALLQWILVSVVCGLLYLLAVIEQKEGPIGFLIWQAVADLFWGLGLLGIYYVSGTLNISEILDPNGYIGLSDGSTALLTSAVLSLLFSLIIRLGMFPTMVWWNGFAGSPMLSSLVLFFPVSLGGFLLFRWELLIAAFPEARTMLIGLGTLSTVTLAISAAVQNGSKQILCLMAVPLGMSLIGIAGVPNLTPQMVGLFAGAQVLGLLLWMNQHAPRQRISSALLMTMLLLLMVGSPAVDKAFASTRFLKMQSGMQVYIVWPLLMASLGLFMAFCVNLILLSHRQDDIQQKQPLKTTTGGLLLLTMTFFFWVFQGGLGGTWMQPRDTPAVPTMLLFGAYAFFIPWREVAVPSQFQSLIDLCRRDYSIEQIIQRGVQRPMLFFAAVFHGIDSNIVRPLLSVLPVKIAEEYEFVANHSEEDAHPEHQTKVLLLAVIVLSCVILAT